MFQNKKDKKMTLIEKIKVGIVGGAGYTSGELLRLLLYHPLVDIVFVHSTSAVGRPIADLHSGLTGDTELTFTDTLQLDSIDVLFLCMAHGDSRKFIESHTLPSHLKLIDLSTDYREKSTQHDFVYGLPEINAEQIRKANHVANPGCFATAIQLAILPLASQRLIRSDLHINAITGSTGAGAKPSATTHFSWRNNNLSVYKPFSHQHLSEITQSVKQLQDDFSHTINFIPLRGNFSRGIFAVSYLQSTLTLHQARELYECFYRSAPFVHMVVSSPDMKQVINTNKAIVYLEKHGDQLLIISTIDNLLKGASGQAVQNMNLMFGLNEKEGLGLKSVGF